MSVYVEPWAAASFAPSALARSWSRAVPTLREVEVRVRYLSSEMKSRPLVAVAEALDDLATRAEQADPIAREILASAVTALAAPDAIDLTDALRQLADHAVLLALARLLRRHGRLPGEPAPIAPPVDERKLATTSTGRVLTLGERRALARKPTRAAFDKLLADPHPMVVANLLQNPRLTEDDVVRMAARRPAYPEVIAALARHPTWSQRARVRMSIVQNPGSPPELAVPMVSLLVRQELQQILLATDVPRVVRAAAVQLLERRPPVPERRGVPDPQ